MIAALNPAVPLPKVEVLANWCNDRGYDHYRLLYSASTLALEGLLHYADPDLVDALAILIYRACPDDRLKFLSVAIALKALISAYRPPFVWLSDYQAGCAAVPIREINGLAMACRGGELAVQDLLDVALCRALAGELQENVSDDDEEAELNWLLLVDSADAGKIVGWGLKGNPLEDRVGILLQILRKMTGNILGSCGKEN